MHSSKFDFRPIIIVSTTKMLIICADEIAKVHHHKFLFPKRKSAGQEAIGAARKGVNDYSYIE